MSEAVHVQTNNLLTCNESTPNANSSWLPDSSESGAFLGNSIAMSLHQTVL